MKCPKCEGDLVKTSTLDRDLKDSDMHYCGGCKVYWLPVYVEGYWFGYNKGVAKTIETLTPLTERGFRNIDPYLIDLAENIRKELVDLKEEVDKWIEKPR